METVIEVEHLCKHFGNFKAVNDISFQVYKGEIFGFLGANGAGKTTAMKMLCGLLSPSSGKGSVAGFNLYTQQNAIKKNIGYMSQKTSLYEDLNIQENMRFFGGIYGMKKKDIKEKTDRSLNEMELMHFRHTLVKELPLGIRQKVSFSIAIFHSPKIVFLDEPTGGVDPVSRRLFWEMINEAAKNGTTLFVTTHYMDEAEYCNRVAIMVDGKIRALESPGELKKNLGVQNMDEAFRSVVIAAKNNLILS